MKHSIVFLIVFLMASVSVCSQSPTYYGDVEPIIINECAKCHKPGGYGPFSLTTYNEVRKKGTFISHVVSTRYMPPWKADPDFRSFKNEMVLTEEEIKTIVDWVDAGMPKGTPTGKELPIPEFLESRSPDLVVTMEEPYTLSNEGIEDYRFFNVPTELPEDTYIQSINFIPGNKRQVHHSRVMADTTNRIRGINGLSEFDPKAMEFQKEPLADEFLYGWVPGNLPLLYPAGTGKKLYANTDLILNIHYAPTGHTEQDQSKVAFYFAKEKVEHEIMTLTLVERHISNPPFFIKANTKPTFYVSYTVREDMRVVSVLPHMHFLGKSFKALAVTPSGKDIPIIKIDEWDFNWQSTYQYDEPLLIPKGSTILVVAEYDNTEDNFANPSSPPKDVGLGWNSTDEMMNLIFYYY